MTPIEDWNKDHDKAMEIAEVAEFKSKEIEDETCLKNG